MAARGRDANLDLSPHDRVELLDDASAREQRAGQLFEFLHDGDDALETVSEQGFRQPKAMLERLKGLSDDHFETHPDEIHWGYVGTLKHYAGLLRQITDSAFKEGEHAA